LNTIRLKLIAYLDEHDEYSKRVGAFFFLVQMEEVAKSAVCPGTTGKYSMQGGSNLARYFRFAIEPSIDRGKGSLFARVGEFR